MKNEEDARRGGRGRKWVSAAIRHLLHTHSRIYISLSKRTRTHAYKSRGTCITSWNNQNAAVDGAFPFRNFCDCVTVTKALKSRSNVYIVANISLRSTCHANTRRQLSLFGNKENLFVSYLISCQISDVTFFLRFTFDMNTFKAESRNYDFIIEISFFSYKET